jgi:hypothetical protein
LPVSLERSAASSPGPLASSPVPPASPPLTFGADAAVEAVLRFPALWPHQVAAGLLQSGRPSFAPPALPVLLVGVRLGIAATLRELRRGPAGVRSLRPFLDPRADH